MMTLGQHLALFRKKFGYKQNQVADAIGISRQSMSSYENDKFVPDIYTIIKIADFYGVSLDSLVGRYRPNTDRRLTTLTRKQVEGMLYCANKVMDDWAKLEKSLREMQLQYDCIDLHQQD